jgi:hypothetical protein
MPIKLRKTEVRIKKCVLVSDRPIIIIPISSGRGEAKIKAPNIENNQRKDFNFHSTWRRFRGECLIKSIISSSRSSLMKRKMAISARKAPRAAAAATGRIEFALAISSKATEAGATVKIEVQNIPAIKLLNRTWVPVKFRSLINVPVLAKIIASMMLNKIINTSLTA